MASPEQLGIAYQKAVAAGDIEAANEIASALNSVAESTDYRAKREPTREAVVARKVGGNILDAVGELAGELKRQYVEPGIKAMQRNQLGLPTQESIAGTEELARNLQPSLRMAPAALAFSPQYRAASMGTQAVISGLGFAAGEGLAGGSPKEQLAAGVRGYGGSYVPTVSPAASEWLRRGQYAGMAAVGGAIQGITEFTAQKIQGASTKEAVSAAKIPAAVGGAFGLVGQLGKTFETYAKEADMAERAFGANAPIAIKSPTVFGSPAAKAERMGSDIGVADVEREVGSKFLAQIGNQVDGAEVVAVLQPYVGKLDEATASLAGLSKNSLRANEQLAAAEAALREARANALNTTKEQQAKLVDNLKGAIGVARAQHAKDIASNAYNLQQLRVSKNYVAPAEARNFFVEKVMVPLESHIKKEAEVLQQSIGIPANANFIPVGDVRNAIKQTDAYRNGGDFIKQKIDGILTGVLRGAKDTDQISRSDAQLMRQELWQMHDADVPGAPKLQTAQLKQMDGAIKGSVEGAIEKVAPESLDALRQFNSYYAGMMEAKSNKAARALFVTNPADEVVTNLVGDLVKDGAEAGAYKGLIQYIDAAAGGSPVVQGEMKSHVFGLIRDNLITRNFGTKDAFIGPVVDLVGLSSDLARLEKGKFNVLETGLNPKMIQETAKLAGNAGLGKSVSAAEFAAIMQNPAVKEAIANGKETGTIVRRITQELGAVRAYKEAKWNQIAGMTSGSRKNFEVAEKRAKEAGKELSEIERSIGDMSNDPLFVAFSGKKNFGLTGEGQANFDQFLSYIADTKRTRGSDVAALLRAVEEKAPEMREQIAIHTLSKAVEFLSKNQLTGERGVDWAAVGKFIDPANPISGDLAKNRLRTIVGDDAYSKLMANMPRIEIVRSLNRQREAVAAGRQSVTEMGTAGRGITQGASGQGFGATIRSIGDLVGRGEYHIAATMMAIPGADKALRAGASVSEIIEKLGPQRAYLIMQNAPKPESSNP